MIKTLNKAIALAERFKAWVPFFWKSADDAVKIMKKTQRKVDAIKYKKIAEIAAMRRSLKDLQASVEAKEEDARKVSNVANMMTMAKEGADSCVEKPVIRLPEAPIVKESTVEHHSV